MAEPTTDMIRAVRAGCCASFAEPCQYPQCADDHADDEGEHWCRRAGFFLCAALKELAKPSEEMVEAAADEIANEIISAPRNSILMRGQRAGKTYGMATLYARCALRAMMNKVLGEPE